MNIVLFARIVAKTDVGMYTKSLAEELVNQGHTVTVMAATNDLHIGDGKLRLSFFQLPFKSKNPIVMLKSLKQMNTFFKVNDIQMVHCQHRVASLYMRIYNLLWRMPYVYTLHNAPIPHDFVHRLFTSVGDKSLYQRKLKSF